MALLGEHISGHLGTGTRWGEAEAAAYAANRHGPDGAVFLDSYFLNLISNVDGRRVLDIGTGNGPWARYMADRGAHVTALDLNMDMLKRAVQEAGPYLKSYHLEYPQMPGITLVRADANKLPVPDGSADLALSSLVGCNLPDLTGHFSETYAALKPGGRFVVTTPNSFDIAFTDGKISPDEIQNRLNTLYEQGGSQLPDKSAENAVLSGVLRATFVRKEGRLTLVSDISELLPGMRIERKIPGLIVPNHYHDVSEYSVAATTAGFEPVVVIQNSFSSQRDLDTYNEEHVEKPLGPEYIGHPPFAVLEFRKPLL